jgi:hypothetical protein
MDLMPLHLQQILILLVQAHLFLKFFTSTFTGMEAALLPIPKPCIMVV